MASAPLPTYLACLTPPGRGAIATLGLRGPLAWFLARELFRPVSSFLPEKPNLGRFWLGRLGDLQAADEVVLAVRQMEPVSWLEIHCHGGIEVVRLLLELFAQRGVEICTWEEFEQETTNDTLVGLARTLLPRAPTVRTAGILLDQIHGAFSKNLQEVTKALAEGQNEIAKKRLEDLLQFESVGRHLVEPWRLVIAGAPNVGKSSLINALAGFERSVVSPMPGTTRDVVTTPLAIDGWPVEAADTAGWRSGAEALEEEGIARAQAAAAEADMCLWVVDASAPPALPADGVLKAHLVINKIDLLPAWDVAQFSAALKVSAKTGEGMTGLCQFISQTLVPIPPSPGVAVPFTSLLADRFRQTLHFLSQGKRLEALESLKAMFIS